jgi:hypothetical protein
MMEKLASHTRGDPAAKAVVFSQFTTFLDVIGNSLKAEGISYGACGHLCPASSPSRGGLTGLAGVTTHPAGYPSGGVLHHCERQLHLLTNCESR